MIILGLTGGIASGKSTVANMFREKGIPVLDSDIYAREAVTPNSPAWVDIKEVFGDEYLLPDGNIDRQKLGAAIFSDAGKREKLNGIIHPRVLARIAKELKIAKRKGEPLVIVDMPLLFEIGYDKQVDITVVVNVGQEEQLNRLRSRDNLTFDEAKGRIAAQQPLAEKAGMAHYVIDNSNSLQETAKQVEQLLHKVLGDSNLADATGDID